MIFVFKVFQLHQCGVFPPKGVAWLSIMSLSIVPGDETRELRTTLLSYHKIEIGHPRLLPSFRKLGGSLIEGVRIN